MGQTFLILLIVVVGIGLAVAVAANRSRRTQSLAAWANSHDLTFHSARDSGFGVRYPHFACLNKGDNWYASNVMQGRIGNYQVCAFDYHCRSDRDEANGCNFSAVIVTTSLPLKPLLIRYKNAFDRVAASVGVEGVQFELAAFNREFYVTSPDPRWAFDVLPQATMEFLINSPKFILEFQLCQIMAHGPRFFRPADFDSAIEVIEGILQSFADLPGARTTRR